MNEEKRMIDLTKRMLKLCDGEQPHLAIGCAFNVVANICDQYPELRHGVATFMERLKPLYEEPLDQVIVEH
jgi:hypothetical protein